MRLGQSDSPRLPRVWHGQLGQSSQPPFHPLPRRPPHSLHRPRQITIRILGIIIASQHLAPMAPAVPPKSPRLITMLWNCQTPHLSPPPGSVQDEEGGVIVSVTGQLAPASRATTAAESSCATLLPLIAHSTLPGGMPNLAAAPSASKSRSITPWWLPYTPAPIGPCWNTNS